MKSILLSLACFISASAFCQKTIPIDSTVAHIGDSVTVCSKVFGVKSLDKVTFINVGAAYPNSPLTIVIFTKDLPNFKSSIETLYANKLICVTGRLKAYNGKPEIVVTRPEEITLQ